jgi:hypothetical protein
VFHATKLSATNQSDNSLAKMPVVQLQGLKVIPPISDVGFAQTGHGLSRRRQPQ